MNAAELINFGSEKLKKQNILSYHIDSEILLSTALGKSRETILVNLNRKIDSEKIIKFKKLINRRACNEPIAYILSEKEFWSKKFVVNSSTLIPRPETEMMVEKLIEIYKRKNISILDIGTGSGCILISILCELKKSSGIGVDISKKALKIAKKNSKLHKINHSVKFIHRSFDDIFNNKFDLIVSNPPYIAERDMSRLDDDIKKHEPFIALNGGVDGLDVIKKVIYKAKDILKINGTLALEIGNGQYKKVSKILNNNNFRIKTKIKDYKDNIRSVISTFLK